MKYLFILGRNVNLSAVEVKAFLEKEDVEFRVLGLAGNGLLIDCNKRLNKVIGSFGGVIAVGEVLVCGDAEKVAEKLDKLNLYHGSSNKLNYAVYDFDAEYFGRFLDYLKHRFKQEGLKATLKKLTGRIKLQSGEEVFKVNSKLVSEQFFVFKDCFGRIIEICDYEKLEKRDMEKPVRRSELSISPRLAKILINLSQTKKNEVLLDPFCGTGAVLQEALLQGIKVVGIDKDRNVLHGAQKNLKWFKIAKENYKLLVGDSSRLNIPMADAVATEPELGELRKSNPSEARAKEMILRFENLIISVLGNIQNKISGKIAFTAPLIIAGKKRFSCDFVKIAFETGMKIADSFPIDEFRENSFVGRSIVVLEKCK